MLESISNNVFEYQKLTPEEQTRRGILGRLVGVIADSKNPTRNGRKYSLELWEKTFQNPIMKEKIENRVCFGEIGHPIDGREEIDAEKIAICLAEIPKINSNGQLMGVFDILNTPCGKILKTLLDYGANIGVSSRGSGDLISGFDGEEVDPNTYECVGWDAVLLPAVKEARVKLVTESLQGKTLNQALSESLDNANEEEKIIMQETLNNLNIKLDEDTSFDYMLLSRLKSDCDYVLTTLKNHRKEYPDQFIDDNRLSDIEHGLWAKDIDKHIDYMLSIYDKLEEKPEWISRDDIENYRLQLHNYVDGIDEDLSGKHCDDIEKYSTVQPVVSSKGEEMEELQNLLKENNELATTITKLQEKLSVSYAKETKMQNKVLNLTNSIRKLTEEAKKLQALESKVSTLNEELNEAKTQLKLTSNQLAYKNKEATLYNNRISLLKDTLTEKLQTINTLNENLSSLNNQLKKMSAQYNENLQDLNNTLKLKQNEYQDKLDKSSKLVEDYKKIASNAVDHYIESQANMLGVNKNEITNRLSKKYSFKDIDTICESIREEKLNFSTLPFRVSSTLTENVKVQPKSYRPDSILPARKDEDDIDDQLRYLAGLQ